ncbi:MAG: hypothetical protein MJ231_05095 [bacterium]|nr:hypothetical protein [bacterium]
MGSNSSNSNTKTTTYGTTSTTNPFVVSKTNNNGTVTSYQKGTAFDTINNFVNDNMPILLEQYLNPTLNSVTNQSKLKSFQDNLSSSTAKNLENDIINPLSKRNMIRSSQATDLYRNLQNSNNSAIASYANELLSGSQSNTASILATLLNAYMNGYSAIADNQAQSLNTSRGNASQTSTFQNNNADYAQLLNLAANAALRSVNL